MINKSSSSETIVVPLSNGDHLIEVDYYEWGGEARLPDAVGHGPRVCSRPAGLVRQVLQRHHDEFTRCELLGVATPGCDEFVVRPEFDDAARLEECDAIG